MYYLITMQYVEYAMKSPCKNCIYANPITMQMKNRVWISPIFARIERGFSLYISLISFERPATNGRECPLSVLYRNKDGKVRCQEL